MIGNPKMVAAIGDLLKRSTCLSMGLATSHTMCQQLIYNSNNIYFFNQKITIAAYHKGKHVGSCRRIPVKLQRKLRPSNKEQAELLEENINMNSKYMSMTCQILKAELRKRNLKVSGKKAELVQRLCRYDNNGDNLRTKSVRQAQKCKKKSMEEGKVILKGQSYLSPDVNQSVINYAKDTYVRHVSTTTAANVKKGQHTIDFNKPAKKVFDPVQHVSDSCNHNLDNNASVHVKKMRATNASSKTKFEAVASPEASNLKKFTVEKASAEKGSIMDGSALRKKLKSVSKKFTDENSTKEHATSKEKSFEQISNGFNKKGITRLNSKTNTKSEKGSANFSDFGKRDILFWGLFSVLTILWWSGTNKDEINN